MNNSNPYSRPANKRTKTIHSSHTSIYQVSFLVKADKANVRSGPGTNYPIIGDLSKDQIIQGPVTTSLWLKVAFMTHTNGEPILKSGFVSKALLKAL